MPTYGEYLRLDELLKLQQAGAEHDEMLFIIIHQSYELWFKQLLHEVDYLCRMLGRDDLSRAGHTIHRVLTILKMLVAKIDILETMTPLEFLGFRERLEQGSGFQSAQFREFEFLLGKRSEEMLRHFPSSSEAARRLEKRFREPSLWDVFLAYLARRGFPIPKRCLDRDVTKPIVPDRDVQRVLVEIYREGKDLMEFCERLVDLDEGLQEWRYRHVKMVERTIGAKPGTGGTSGAAYLRTTLMQPLYPDLWAIRDDF